MIIGIDGNEANIERRVGIGEYAYELLRQFAKLRIKNLEFRIYLKSEPLKDMPVEGENWEYRVIKPGKLWTQWRLPLDLYLHNPKPDVFFSPSHYAPRFSPVSSVISVMDLSYLFFPQLFNAADLHQLQSWTAYSARQAKKILTISNSSKNDIIKEYNIAPGDVVVTYPGIKGTNSLSPSIYKMNNLRNKYDLSENYILFVGTLQPRKNIQRLIEAFAQVITDKKSPKNLQLIIVGKKGWLFEDILNTPSKLGIENSVRFLDQVDNDELDVLYKNALCFVLPSLYEGFGLPVLEAMQNGCPVIVSDVSSLPEAGGDACLYVDPENTEDIKEKILDLINDQKLRKELIEKGKKQIEKFSWEKTAKETLKVLTELGGRNER